MARDTASQAFWDRVARRYAAMAMRNPEAYAATLERVRAHLSPDARALELGCGTGTTALALAGDVAHYVASDYAPQMIAIAEEKRAEAGIANLTLCTGRLGDASLPDGPFDAVLAFNLLHLLPERRAVLAQVHRALRTGGVFISKTPCLGGAYRLLWPPLVALRALGKAPDFHFLPAARLEREIAAAGFVIAETGNFPKRPQGRFIVARRT